MVECWNIGKMDLGILQYWVNGKIRFELKVRIDKILQKPTIPSFHYSIIPGLRQIRMPQKIPFLFNQLYKFRDV
jgi:hypothetical protein